MVEVKRVCVCNKVDSGVAGFSTQEVKINQVNNLDEDEYSRSIVEEIKTILKLNKLNQCL